MNEDKQTIIIGAGVTGLTTGIKMLKNGFSHVKIVAKEFHPHITSSVAAAVWVPYKVAPVSKAKDWCQISYKHLESMADNTPGVTWINCTQLFTDPGVKPEWVDMVETGSRPSFIPSGYRTVITTRIPLMDVTYYLPWLQEAFQDLGGVIEKRQLHNFNEIANECDLIVNCAGLGAKELAGDEDIKPISGQVIVTKLPENLDYAIACDEDPDALTYIIPRKPSQTCVIGGTVLNNDDDPKPDETITHNILERASKLCPYINTDISILQTIKGFRPSREQVCLCLDELKEDRTPIIHNYGHGGGGYAIAWGCATEVTQMAQGLELEPLSKLKM